MTREEIAEILRKQTLSFRYWNEMCLCRYVYDDDKLTDKDRPPEWNKSENPWYRSDLVSYANHLENVLELIYSALLDEDIEIDWKEICDNLYFKDYITRPVEENDKILGLREDEICFGDYEAGQNLFFGKDYKERLREEQKVRDFRNKLRRLSNETQTE